MLCPSVRHSQALCSPAVTRHPLLDSQGLFETHSNVVPGSIIARKVPSRLDRLQDHSNDERVQMASHAQSCLLHLSASWLVIAHRPDQSSKASSDPQFALHVHAPRPSRPIGPVLGLQRRAWHCRHRSFSAEPKSLEYGA